MLNNKCMPSVAVGEQLFNLQVKCIKYHHSELQPKPFMDYLVVCLKATSWQHKER